MGAEAFIFLSWSFPPWASWTYYSAAITTESMVMLSPGIFYLHSNPILYIDFNLPIKLNFGKNRCSVLVTSLVTLDISGRCNRYYRTRKKEKVVFLRHVTTDHPRGSRLTFRGLLDTDPLVLFLFHMKKQNEMCLQWFVVLAKQGAASEQPGI